MQNIYKMKKNVLTLHCTRGKSVAPASGSPSKEWKSLKEGLKGKKISMNG